MQATEQLSEEHRVIEVVLNVLDDLAREVEEGQSLDRDRAARALVVLRNFADKCHHGKEEHHLFARMTEKGFPREAGPLGVMLFEHGQGRRHVQAMERALQTHLEEAPEADREFAQHAREYATLLRAHIQREDHVLFPMIQKLFTPEEDAALVAAFEQVEREEIGEGAHERYHEWAHELTAGRREAA